jgi:hypothetical protein
MPFVIFTAPYFTDIAIRFIESLARLPDVKLGLLTAEPFDKLPRHLLGGIAGYLTIGDVTSTKELVRGARALQGYVKEPIYRMFGANEQIQVPMAEARAELSIPGMGVDATRSFRDKDRMKSLLGAAGIPRARHAMASSAEDVWAFARLSGFPIVIKPPDGAAAQSTFRADDEAHLREQLPKVKVSAEQPVLVEEFVVGDEHSFETITIDGKHVWHSLTHYHPTPLEVLHNPWIQWSVVLPREIDDPKYDDIRDAAHKTLDTLGMDTGLSHLEWFRRKDVSLVISEVGARPPGAEFTTLVAYAHEIDFLYAWARVMVHGDFDPPKRRFAAGIAYLRGQGAGTIRAIHGLDEVEKEVGHLVMKSKLPVVGRLRSAGYEGDGYLIVRHEQTDVVQKTLAHIISKVRVECS